MRSRHLRRASLTLALTLTALTCTWAQPPEPEGKHPLFYLWLCVILFLVEIVALGAVTAFAAVLAATKTEFVERLAGVLDERRGAAFGWGLPITGVLILLTAAFLDPKNHARPVGFLLLGVLLTLALLGGAGLAVKVGRQLLQALGRPVQPVAASAGLGAAALFLLTWIPLVGWAYGGYNLILCLGALRLGALPARKRPRTDALGVDPGSDPHDLREPAPASPTDPV